jgi:hypothetical protein
MQMELEIHMKLIYIDGSILQGLTRWTARVVPAAGAVYASSAYDSEVHFAKSPSMIQNLP